MHTLNQGFSQLRAARAQSCPRQYFQEKKPSDPAIQRLAGGESVGQLDQLCLSFFGMITQEGQLCVNDVDDSFLIAGL